MKQIVNTRSIGLGLLLLACAASCAALTLGRVQGAAWIGQPLDVVIPIALDNESSDAPMCPQADIFDGDSRHDPAGVRTSIESSGQADHVNLHISSAASVEEPIVTAYVRIGCNVKISRRYVMLGEYRNTATPAAPLPSAMPLPNAGPLANTAPLPNAGPSTNTTLLPNTAPLPSAVPQTSAAPLRSASAPAAAPDVKVAPPAAASASKPVSKPVAKPMPATSAVAAASSASRASTAPSAAPAPSTPSTPSGSASSSATTASSPLPKPAATKPIAASSAAPKRARLQLDPLDHIAERIVALEHPVASAASAPVSALASAPASTPASAPAEPTPSAQVQALQNDIQHLLEQANANQAALLALHERLEQQQANQTPLLVLYVLLGLIALCLIALTFSWLRHNALLASYLRSGTKPTS